jgi:dipeptidyl aminopeptidase/acylaminoacyl peptidase
MQGEMRQGRPLILALIALFATPGTAAADGRIAFVSERDGNNEVYVMNDDGTEPRRLTHSEEPDVAPAWSPDGRRIAFVRGFGPDADVWVMNADGTGELRVTQAPGADREPTWSPDGRWIAFSGDRGSGAEIRAVPADGGAERTLTRTGGVAAGPAWSPDGSRIAFWREDLMQLRVVDAAGGTDRTLVAPGPRADRDPSWSPDGRHVVFTGHVDPLRDLDIYAAAADDSRTVPLATVEGRDTNPAWGADGRIAFASERGGAGLDIYVMNADGSNPTRLTATAGEDDMPAWAPPPPVALTVEDGPAPTSEPGTSAPPPGDTRRTAPARSRGRLTLALLRGGSRIRIEERLVRLRLKLRASAASVATLELRRDGRRVARFTRRLRRGVTTVRWAKPIARPARWRGRRYEVFLITLTPRAT